MKYAVAAFLAMMSLVFAEHAPAAEPKAILVFGDSLSEGFMLKHSEAYSALLAKKLRAAGLNFSVTNASADQIQNNLQQIIDKVKARNPNACVVIAGMQLPGYAGDDYVSAFGQMFADLAVKNRAALVPYLLEGVAGNPSLNLSDGIHPNAAGQKVLAENVWRVLEPVAREMAKP